MICPSGQRLAAAASGEDDAARAHAEACAACATALARERATQALVGALPAVQLDPDRRAGMRAHLLAASDAMPTIPRHRPGPRSVVAIVAAALAAAVVALLLTRRSPPPEHGDEVAVVVADAGAGSQTAIAVPVDAAAGEPKAAPKVAADIESRGAWFERTGDHVQLTEGTITVDARGRLPTKVIAQGMRIAVVDAKVRILARAGQVAQVQVFAGTAEITVGGRVQVVEAGDVWELPAPRAVNRPPVPTEDPASGSARASTSRAPSAPDVDSRAPSAPDAGSASPARPSSPTTAVGVASPARRAFRLGWEALRGGRYAEAITAFDRATDPAVIEDAMYWAAIAAARAGDQTESHRRLRMFLAAFPASPHAAKARAALDR